MFRTDDDEIVRGANGRKVNKTVVELSISRGSKNEKSENLTCIGATEKSTFLIPGAKETFNRLKQAFIKAPIL